METDSPNNWIPKVSIDVAEERKKTRLVTIVFCEYAAKLESGTVLLAGVFDRFNFSKDEEKITTDFYVFAKALETGNGDFQLTIFNPENTLIWGIRYEVEEQKWLPQYPSQIQLLQRVKFPVPIEGVYWFDVSFNGKSLGGSGLIIDFQKEAAQANEHESGNVSEHS